MPLPTLFCLSLRLASNRPRSPVFLALSLMRQPARSTRASYLLPYSFFTLFFLTPRRVARSPLPLPYELYPAREKGDLCSCSLHLGHRRKIGYT
jgi:hypothetical protein